MEQLVINAALQISKSAHEVFEAIVDPDKMSGYFISESSGRMEEGKELSWKFPEFDERSTVRVLKVKEDELISFEWDGDGGRKLQVEITLAEQENGATLVRITEGTMEVDEAGLRWLKGNTEGWANFLACLKAYLEYGINLRKGGFDFMKK
jgi:uncharacterized protein YndB with AHSA1/START domain